MSKKAKESAIELHKSYKNMYKPQPMPKTKEHFEPIILGGEVFLKDIEEKENNG